VGSVLALATPGNRRFGSPRRACVDSTGIARPARSAQSHQPDRTAAAVAETLLTGSLHERTPQPSAGGTCSAATQIRPSPSFHNRRDTSSVPHRRHALRRNQARTLPTASRLAASNPVEAEALSGEDRLLHRRQSGHHVSASASVGGWLEAEAVRGVAGIGEAPRPSCEQRSRPGSPSPVEAGAGRSSAQQGPGSLRVLARGRPGPVRAP
jgi:hypothetical protein